MTHHHDDGYWRPLRGAMIGALLALVLFWIPVGLLMYWAVR
jgi:hypothetical protein